MRRNGAARTALVGCMCTIKEGMRYIRARKCKKGADELMYSTTKYGLLGQALFEFFFSAKSIMANIKFLGQPSGQPSDQS